MRQVGRNVFLEEAAKRVGRGKHLVGGTEGQQSIGIDFFQAYGQLFRGAANHARKEKAREVVGDYDTGTVGEGSEQTLALAHGAFDVRMIKDLTAGKIPQFLRHALQDELMQAIAGPGVIATERFQNHQGLLEFAGPFDSMIQRKVPMGAAERDHPVQDEIFLRPDGLVVASADANFGDCGQLAPPQDGPELKVSLAAKRQQRSTNINEYHPARARDTQENS